MPCAKSVQIRSFFWSLFSHIWIEYGEILRISPYSVRMRENTDQTNSEYGYLLRSEDVSPSKNLPFMKFILKEEWLCRGLNNDIFQNFCVETCFKVTARKI